MPDKSETLSLIQKFSRKKKSPSINYPSFLTFVETYVESQKNKEPELEIYSENTHTVLVSELEDLAGSGQINLDYENSQIQRIFFPGYFLASLHEEYKRIEENSEVPFPSEEALGLTIPQDLLSAINVKNDFVNWLRKIDDVPDTEIYRLIFPEGFKSIIIPADIMKTKLLELSFDKIRAYLGTRRNLNYIHNKLLGLLGSKNVVLKETIENVVSKPGYCLEQIKKPTDFSFRLWTTIANLIIQEYRRKVNKLVDELSYCQASYLLGFYVVFNKSIIQKEKDSHAAIQSLDKSIRKSPYYFTVSEIYQFTDSKGVPLTKRCSRDEIHKYLSEKSRPEKDKAIPEIIRLEVPGKKQYFISKDVLLPLCVKKINDASSEYRKIYVNKWESELRECRKTEEMTNDQQFVQNLEDRLKEEDPLLYGLLNYELLFLTKEETQCNQNVEFNIMRLFDSKKKGLIPMNEIFKLDRNEILTDAKRRLPMWQVMPVFGPLFIFFKRLLQGSKKGKRKRDLTPGSAAGKAKPSGYKTAERSGFKKVGKTAPAPAVPEPSGKKIKTSAQTAKAKLIAYRKQVTEISKEFIEDGKTIDGSMKELINRWNPLFDEKARKNLIEDVNSMVRDFIRGLRKGILKQPPNAESIRTMAGRLAANDVFAKIKRKEEFKLYIELYMLKILSRE